MTIGEKSVPLNPGMFPDSIVTHQNLRFENILMVAMLMKPRFC